MQSRLGSDRLSHALRRSTIGAKGFHFRVRNGIEWDTLAITTKPTSHPAELDHNFIISGSTRCCMERLASKHPRPAALGHLDHILERQPEGLFLLAELDHNFIISGNTQCCRERLASKHPRPAALECSYPRNTPRTSPRLSHAMPPMERPKARQYWKEQSQ